jgi:prepilin-type N-terminal cleavage/methylation domain-containing protein
MLRLKKNRAFTLIELIVVVIIIGVLAAIAAVAYNAFIGSARSTSILATAAAVDQAVTAHSASDDSAPGTDVKPTVAVAAGATSFTGVFGVNLNNSKAYVDSATPTEIQLSSGSHYACDTLGTNPGQSGVVTAGVCATAVTPGPTVALN